MRFCRAMSTLAPDPRHRRHLSDYDTQGHEIGRNERPAGLEAFFPLCMLDDGRLLMVVATTGSTTARPVRRDGRGRISERRVGISRDDVCGVNGPALQGTARWAVPAAAEFSITGKDVYP